MVEIRFVPNFVISLSILNIFSYKETCHKAATLIMSIAFLIKVKWLRQMRNRKKSMKFPKAGGATKSEGKVL